MSETPSIREEPRNSEVERAVDAGKNEEQTILVEAPPPSPSLLPNKLELVWWHIFSFCSYFVLSFLVPVLFPLMITQRAWPKFDLSPPAFTTPLGVACREKEMILYQKLTHPSIAISSSKFSPLRWTTISWAVTVVLAIPIITLTAHHLDHGNHQRSILIGAIVAGALSCLLTGFFETIWLFPFLIAIIAISSIIGTAIQARHLGLMVRGLTDRATGNLYFPHRRAINSWLSFNGTAAGSLGAAMIAVFSYHMLRRTDQLTSLWVVFIFSGLQWLGGVTHATLSNPGCSSPIKSNYLAKCAHMLTIFNYPHAICGLATVFLSSFACMCIFASGVLYIIGDLCIKPLILLVLWMIYFAFPAVSLSALHPLQLIISADAVSMQLLGFFMSAFTSGLGFYFKDEKWKQLHIILATFLQSTANGVLHASGRAMLVDCSPEGKEGAFGMWFAWAKAVGGCAGFAVGTASPGNVRTTFAIALLASFLGVFVLIFGNVSNARGMVAAGHVQEEENVKRSAV